MNRVHFARTLAGLGLTLGAAACSDNGPETAQLTAANSVAVAAAAVGAMNMSLDGLDSDAIDITGFLWHCARDLVFERVRGGDVQHSTVGQRVEVIDNHVDHLVAKAAHLLSVECEIHCHWRILAVQRGNCTAG